jgi:two-component system phosphate regulon response regulator OmpR
MVHAATPYAPSLPPHILVVDDDTRIRELLGQYLQANGFLCSMADSALQARDLLTLLQFDVLVVDVMMPDEDGLSLTKHILQNPNMPNPPPILLLTALSDTTDKIVGLEAGADDYLAKPFDPRELILRLHALLRRTKTTNLNAPQFGSWQFDAARCHMHNTMGDILALTEGEGKLLALMLQHVGTPLSRTFLAKQLQLEGQERTIDMQVNRLRRKLEPDQKQPRYLQTLRGSGYMLKPDEV